MKALLKAEDYVSERVWQAEEMFFKKNWCFVGFTRDLENNNDYITVKIHEVSVFVQNIKGELSAFRNVCPHRFSAMKAEPKGNSMLLCPYHSWSFKACGKVRAIPKKKEFDFSEDELEQISLEKWAVDTCGEFVFVKRDDDGPSLKESLGDYAEHLEEFSLYLGEKVDENVIIMECNWKIALENTLESYHVPKIHATTFAKLGSDGNDFGFTEKHSNWQTALDPKVTKKVKKLAKLLDQKSKDVEGYIHYLIYPNMTLACSFGSSFAIQEFVPMGKDKTKFISHVFLPKYENVTEIRQTILDSFSRDMSAFNRKVFDEDKVICAQVHLGCQNAWDKDGFLCTAEDRVAAFQKCYLDDMSPE